jgi:hypothetical protein
MLIIGVDYHPSDQYIAFVDPETGECGEQRLNHQNREAEQFYRDLKQRGVSVRVGMEATGYSRWFERLLADLGIEVWIGDAAKIKTKRVRKQKTDRQDAQLLLKLLLENNFPRVWVPSPENRDLRQLLWHRHRLVQMRTRIMNQLQALAMNEGNRRKKKLWSALGRAQLEKLPLATWASRRRQDLLELLDRMNPSIEALTAAVEQCPVRIAASSDGRRNTCLKFTRRSLKSQGLSWDVDSSAARPGRAALENSQTGRFLAGSIAVRADWCFRSCHAARDFADRRSRPAHRSYRKVLVFGHLQSAIPRQRAPQGSGEFTNMPTQCRHHTAVSLLGTLISIAKRE